MTSRRRVRTRSLAVLFSAAVLALVAGTATVVLATAAPGWILAQLAGTGVVTDAAAVGGAAAALGYAALVVGAGLIGLGMALRSGRPWASPVAAVIVGAILAALVGSLAAALASLAREPGSGLVYGLVAGGIGLALAAFAMVLLDLLRGAGPPD